MIAVAIQSNFQWQINHHWSHRSVGWMWLRYLTFWPSFRKYQIQPRTNSLRNFKSMFHKMAFRASFSDCLPNAVARYWCGAPRSLIVMQKYFDHFSDRQSSELNWIILLLLLLCFATIIIFQEVNYLSERSYPKILMIFNEDLEKIFTLQIHETP